MTGAVARVRESLRTGFWAVPAACVVTALLLALVLVEVDRSLAEGLGAVTFGAGPDGAREVLSAITTSMITFTGLVFSITIVVLQLTSSQFSPRVLRTFLRDRVTQVSLGVFVATFVYAVMVLRTVRSGDDDQFVPAISTTVGVALLLASVAVFVGYIHHIAKAIQVSSVIRSIAEETREAIERQMPEDREPDPRGVPQLGDPARVVASARYGVVSTVDVPALVDAAKQAGVVLVLVPGPGQFVPQGAPLVEVHGQPDAVDDDVLRTAVSLTRDRTMQQDVAFGFRQLVDVAERALSPGTNDPTTAVEVLDELHDLLRRLATRPLPDGVHRDDDGALRLLTRPHRFEDYLDLALREIEHYGAEAPQVQERLAALLDDLERASRPEARPHVARRRRARRRRAASTAAG